MGDVNWLAILVAALLPMIIGFLWYGPLFGKKWMSLMGTTEEEIKAGFNPMKSYGVSFIGAILTAYVMARLMGDGMDMSALTFGGMCWLGFYLTHGWQAVAYEGKSMSLYALNMGYNLVALLAMAFLLDAWQ